MLIYMALTRRGMVVGRAGRGVGVGVWKDAAAVSADPRVDADLATNATLVVTTALTVEAQAIILDKTITNTPGTLEGATQSQHSAMVPAMLRINPMSNALFHLLRLHMAPPTARQ